MKAEVLNDGCKAVCLHFLYGGAPAHTHVPVRALQSSWLDRFSHMGHRV